MNNTLASHVLFMHLKTVGFRICAKIVFSIGCIKKAIIIVLTQLKNTAGSFEKREINGINGKALSTLESHLFNTINKHNYET